MGTENCAVKVVPKRCIEREAIAVHAEDLEGSCESPLNFGPSPEQVNRSLERLWGNLRATISRRNAEAKQEFAWNLVLQVMLESFVFRYDYDETSKVREFFSLVKRLGDPPPVHDVTSHRYQWSR